MALTNKFSFCDFWKLKKEQKDVERNILFSDVLVIIAPFLPPANVIGDTPPLPYYLSVYSFILTLETTLFTPFVFGIRYCLVAIDIIVWGIIYWPVSSQCVVLPKIFLDTSWYQTSDIRKTWKCLTTLHLT